MIVETYQEKAKGTIKPIIKGDYELIDTIIYNQLWNSNIEFWDQIARTNNNYLEEISEGCFKFDLRSDYGIHTYQLVYPTKSAPISKIINLKI